MQHITRNISTESKTQFIYIIHPALTETNQEKNKIVATKSNVRSHQEPYVQHKNKMSKKLTQRTTLENGGEEGLAQVT